MFHVGRRLLVSVPFPTNREFRVNRRLPSPRTFNGRTTFPLVLGLLGHLGKQLPGEQSEPFRSEGDPYMGTVDTWGLSRRIPNTLFSTFVSPVMMVVVTGRDAYPHA